LRDFILSLSPGSDDAIITASAAETLVKIKHDVVNTIRQVVDVVSRYAGVALPEQAKRYIRQAILQLPARWANSVQNLNANANGNNGSATTSTSTNAVGNGDAGDSASKGQAPDQDGEPPKMSTTREAAERVLAFAVDSLEMLRSVNAVFAESAARAEECVSIHLIVSPRVGLMQIPPFSWIERLRVIGVERRAQKEAEASGHGGDIEGTSRQVEGGIDSNNGSAMPPVEREVQQGEGVEDQATNDLATQPSAAAVATGGKRRKQHSEEGREQSVGRGTGRATRRRTSPERAGGEDAAASMEVDE
jgi:hypothetical protein